MKLDKQETHVNRAFSKKSKVYEEYGQSNPIVKWSRRRVYKHLIKFLTPNSSILELNGGTGEDALYLARRGHDVHILEIADGMIEKIKEKISKDYQGNITYKKQSYLNFLNIPKSSIDHIFSNFGGLNLTPSLKPVFAQFPHVLKPGGYVTVVLLNQISLWELTTIFWNKKNALRRIPSIFGHPILSKVEGESVFTYYFSLNNVVNSLNSSFHPILIEGLCIFVPPSYFEDFPIKYPRFFKRLQNLEERLSENNTFAKLGDFFIATFQYLP